jgi:murein DD-endopeptidase MepM/ murein hydrolase activator NlpD
VPHRLATTLTAVVVLTAACGDTGATSAPTAATSPPTTAPSAANPAPAPIPATTPPPASYAEVEADYTAKVDAIRILGRVAADQFLSDDFAALEARFDAVMAAQLSADDVAAGKAELESQASLGDLGLERAIHQSPALRAYGVEVAWGEEALTLNAIFNENDEISGLFINSVLPLPPDPAAGFESAVEFRLPFDGLWFTFWGGDNSIQNYHVDAAVQRHAFDFLIWKDDGTHTGDGTAVTDYWAYGQPVLAPADGAVVTVVDGLADQVPMTVGDATNPAGNHVIIEVAEGEYLLIAHLQAGSLRVAEGDDVESGQQIGLVGNSGSTTEPHIHIHLQREPVFLTTGSGLPLVFTDYVANGDIVERDQPLGDQFVRNG